MSNAERQRLFQKRHPGYDRRRKARERAAYRQIMERVREAARALVTQTAPVEPPAPIAPERPAEPVLPGPPAPAR